MTDLNSDAELARVLGLKGDDIPAGGRVQTDAGEVKGLIAASWSQFGVGISWVRLEAGVVDLQDWMHGPMHAAGHWIIHHQTHHLQSHDKWVVIGRCAGMIMSTQKHSIVASHASNGLCSKTGMQTRYELPISAAACI